MLELHLTLLRVLVACLLVTSIAHADEATFPVATSKKGLQVEQVDDALALGIAHAAINVNLSGLFVPPGGEQGEGVLVVEHHGKPLAVRRGYLEALDATIRPLSDRGVLVYVILLAYASGNAEQDAVLLHPNYDPAAPNRLGALNTRSPESREQIEALLSFLAARWSDPAQTHGRVVGYIVGNEVNSHWYWNNQGRASFEQLAEDYWQSLKLVQRAIRGAASWPRVYLSLEHHWNIRYPAADEHQAFPGKWLIDDFARRASESPEDNFDWHVAFHPYPENLFEPRFWKDKTALPSHDTPRITFKNVEVLTEYLKRPELLHNGVPRRVILSEQGFHTPATADGEAVQAAAYCLAYELVERLDGIDAFILHRHVDHPDEGGLLLGLRRREADGTTPAKKIWSCFQAGGTDRWADESAFARDIVGPNLWDEMVPAKVD
jgi:hypothetical protein